MMEIYQMDAVEFSVLMSVYKGEKQEYLSVALDSIINQTLPPSEIVIVEDGELNNELYIRLDEYSSKYPSLIKRLPFPQNRGLGISLKDGVNACKYDYIARMDTDDIAMPNRFEKQFQYLKENEDISLLGSWITEFSDNPQCPDTLTKLPTEHEDIVKFAKRRNPFRHMSVVFKKSAVVKSGNYRDFLWFEDYDLWIRMIQSGYRVANLPEVLVNVRADGNMFARRGGIAYINREVRFQLSVYKSDFIKFDTLVYNLFVRILVRVFPNKLRIFVYKKLFRVNHWNNK